MKTTNLKTSQLIYNGTVIWVNPPNLGHFAIKLRKQIREDEIIKNMEQRAAWKRKDDIR